MIGITNDTILADLNTIQDLFDKYNDAIWETQENQSGHYDKQSKLVRILMCDIRSGLNSTRCALKLLSNSGVVED